MRRFYKTFTCARHTQYAVVDDGLARFAYVMRWTATDFDVTTQAVVPYAGIGRHRAKAAAAQLAERLAAGTLSLREVDLATAHAIKVARAAAQRAGDCSVCGEAVQKHFNARNEKRSCREAFDAR